MAFVLMKIFEEAPRRFDRWMNILTFGRLRDIRERIVDELIGPGAAVLEIGCGTGSLLAQMAGRGARVTGIDIAEAMVETARRNLAEAGVADRGEVQRLLAIEIEDAFRAASFDRVLSILALSEMSVEEVDCLLPQCRKVLRPGGRLILVDETVPEGFLRRGLYQSYRFVSRLATYLGLQAAELKKASWFMKILYFVIELPLMLLAFFVVPAVTQPLRAIEDRIESAGFRLLAAESYLGGSLKLFQAEVAS